MCVPNKNHFHFSGNYSYYEEISDKNLKNQSLFDCIIMQDIVSFAQYIQNGYENKQKYLLTDNNN